MISIIIPTLNEEQYLEDCLRSMPKDDQSEIIVVDGNSTDATVAIATSFGVKVICLTISNRAMQMNVGAEAATGDILLFFHADSRLPAGAITAIHKVMLDPQVFGGAFDLGFYPVQLFYSLLAIGANFFCRMTQMIFGDRGMFIRTTDFWCIGGYTVLDIMEDAALGTKMREQGKIKIISDIVMTSARKYATETKLQAIYRTVWAYCAYRLGVPAAKIKAGYYGLASKKNSKEE